MFSFTMNSRSFFKLLVLSFLLGGFGQCSEDNCDPLCPPAKRRKIAQVNTAENDLDILASLAVRELDTLSDDNKTKSPQTGAHHDNIDNTQLEDSESHDNELPIVRTPIITVPGLTEKQQKLLQVINEVVPTLPDPNLDQDQSNQFWKHKTKEVLSKISNIKKFASLKITLKRFPKLTDAAIREKVKCICSAAGRLRGKENQETNTLSENQQKLLQVISDVVQELPNPNLDPDKSKKFWEDKAKEVLSNISHIKKLSSLEIALRYFPKSNDTVTLEKIVSIRSAAGRLAKKENQKTNILSENQQNLLEVIDEVVPVIPASNLTQDQFNLFWEDKAKKVLSKISHLNKFSSLSIALEKMPRSGDADIQEKIDSIRKAAGRLYEKEKKYKK